MVVEIECQGEDVLDVERWAELRREHFVRGVSGGVALAGAAGVSLPGASVEA